jgi:ribonuclease J
MLKIIPLGGLGEIGLNMMVFEYQDALFIVDVGLMFPEDYMLGIDIVIPEWEYVKQRRQQLAGIVLTHAHEDHIGALPYFLRDINREVPIYCTPFTQAVIRHKLEEHDLLTSIDLHEVHAGDAIELGPFGIEFISVNHSTVDGVGLAIETPVGRVIHTGDFKLNHSSSGGNKTDVERFTRLGDEGVLALLSDSTNVEKEGFTLPDQVVAQTLDQIVSESRGRVIVALFASNVIRIQQIVDIARKRNRKVIFNGRSIELTVRIARELGYLRLPHDMEIDISQVNEFPDDQVLMITTGSQGEPMSVLARIAGGMHKQIKVKVDDTIILSSKFIPGNERAIAGIINNLYRQGANVIYEKISDIHVSGHAFQEELKEMIRMVRPRYFIPIHGEYRHLIHHARLAQETGIPGERVLLAENGQIIAFDENGGHLLDSIKTGRVLVDGKGVGDIGRSVLKERRILSEDGLVVVTLVLDEETGIIINGPDIISRGFVFLTETGHLVDDAQCVILEIIDETPPETPDRINLIRARLKKALKQYFYFTIKRRPVILPIVLVV